MDGVTQLRFRFMPPLPSVLGMTYELAIGDRAYSSWSLRGWLLCDAFGLDTRVRRAQMRTPEFAALLEGFAPARQVPAARLDGTVVWDSLAIAEELASRHPHAGHWPDDPALRGLARSISAEMHAGFGALRSACPMNLRTAWGYAPTPEVRADLERLEDLWDRAWDASGGPWLCGAYSAADAFYAPVAMRIAGYGLPVSDRAGAYVERHLAHPSLRRWRAMSACDGPDQEVYEMGLPRRPFPGAPERRGAVVDGPSVNGACPYSGEPVTHFMAFEGRTWGFCNAFCCDKTMADPLAWPQFVEMMERG